MWRSVRLLSTATNSTRCWHSGRTRSLCPKYPPKEGWVIRRDPQGKSPNVSLNKIPKNVKGRIRLHLDLYMTDQEGGVERLLKMGGTLYLRDYKPDEDFRILVDPEGNLFCVVQVPKDEKTIVNRAQHLAFFPFFDAGLLFAHRLSGISLISS